MKCEHCNSNYDDDLIDVKVCIPNGNTDDNELNNYNIKTISVCSLCSIIIKHNRNVCVHIPIVGDEE